MDNIIIAWLYLPHVLHVAAKNNSILIEGR